MDATAAGEPALSSRISLRNRIFAVLTANVAGAFALAGWYAAEKQVLPVNSARVIEIYILQKEMRIKANGWTSTGVDTTRPATGAATRKRDVAQELHDIERQIAVLTKQIGTTAVIAYVWKYLMYITAAILEVAAFLGTTRHGRRAYLVAGWAILVSTVCTIVAMKLLIDPSFGGMESLARRSYVYIALIQGGYGAILLAVFWPGKRRPGNGHCPAAETDDAKRTQWVKPADGRN